MRKYHRKIVETTQESDTGRNKRFINKETGENMTRSQFVKEIELGKYPGYHIKKGKWNKNSCI